MHKAKHEKQFGERGKWKKKKRSAEEGRKEILFKEKEREIE